MHDERVMCINSFRNFYHIVMKEKFQPKGGWKICCMRVILEVTETHSWYMMVDILSASRWQNCLVVTEIKSRIYPGSYSP